MTFALTSRGPFSLDAAGTFAESFPGTKADRAPDGLWFAWAVDGDWRTVTVTVRQSGGAVRGEFDGAPPPDLTRPARRDVERILCLDADGIGFSALGERDPVIGALQRRFRGLRPVLFCTPYEAAAWAIIGHRIRIRQAAAIKQRLADELGEHGAFPAPDRLATLSGPQRGLNDRKVAQLRGIADAARDGQLTRDRLRTMPFDDAARDLQTIAGIGPFSAELILIRGVGGDPDTLPHHEQRLARAARAAYRLPDDADIEPTAETWRPYRGWVAFLLRSWLEDETNEIATGRRTTTPPLLRIERGPRRLRGGGGTHRPAVVLAPGSRSLLE